MKTTSTLPVVRTVDDVTIAVAHVRGGGKVTLMGSRSTIARAPERTAKLFQRYVRDLDHARILETRSNG